MVIKRFEYNYSFFKRLQGSRAPDLNNKLIKNDTLMVTISNIAIITKLDNTHQL